MRRVFVIFTDIRKTPELALNSKVYHFYVPSTVELGDVLVTSNYQTRLQVVGVGEEINPSCIKNYINLDIVRIERKDESTPTEILDNVVSYTLRYSNPSPLA